MSIAEQLAYREVGTTVPVAIGTAVAIESLAEKQSFWPQEIWFNLRTLFRNLYGCINSIVRQKLVGHELTDTFLQEMQVIRDAVSTITNGVSKARFYYCDYRDITMHFPKAVLRTANTPLQQGYLASEQYCLKPIIDKAEDHGVDVFHTKIKGTPVSVLIVTHSPIDLLWAGSFGKLKLLESHTGAIKPKSQWHTKLTNGKELTRIPFNRLTVQVFGDNNNFFSAMPIKIKKTVLDLAEKYKWTVITTDDKIRYSINQMQDKFGRDWLRSLL